MGNSSKARVLSGLLLATAGAILLIDRLNGAQQLVALVAQWWPLVLVALGLRTLATFALPPFASPSLRTPVLAGFCVLLAGLLVLFVTVGVVEPGPTLLPAALIAAGVGVALAGGGHDRRARPWVAETAILTRRRFYSQSKRLRQLSAVAVLGEITLDLSKATVAGDAELQITLWWGQARVRLASTVVVEVREPAGAQLNVETIGAPSAETGPTLSVSILGAFGRTRIEWA